METSINSGSAVRELPPDPASFQRADQPLRPAGKFQSSAHPLRPDGRHRTGRVAAPAPGRALFGSPYLLILGSDVCRRTKQCMEWSRSKAREGEPALVEQSFARMPVESPLP